MKQSLGSKNGRNNKRLLFLNLRRKKHLENIEQEEIKKRKNFENKKKEIIIITKNKTEVKEIIDTKINYHPTKIKNIEKIKIKNKNLLNETKEIKISETKKEIDIKIEPPTKNKNINTTPIYTTEKTNIEKQEIIIPTIKNNNKKKETQKITNNEEYLEKQIIKILDNQIDENRFKLKKMDSEIHTIKKEINNLTTKEDTEEIEKEIEILIEKLNKIIKQINSLQKTLELDFPVENPDNYLIHLVEEYKEKRNKEKELSDKLNDNKEFKSIIDKIIEIEENHDFLLKKTEEKKKKLNLDNDQVEKMNDNVIDIENIKKNIEKMVNIQNHLLEEIKTKVNETVNITEKVDYITKRVNHSLFELFLLMSILKHNLSIKNNIVAAVTVKITLDTILKMTTPTQEKVITKVADVKNYENLINGCLNNTEKLESLMNTNLNSISYIRYQFENDYKECSYLNNYKEAMDKLIKLEYEMKERKKDVIKIKNETLLELEKNNAKIKKYNSI